MHQAAHVYGWEVIDSSAAALITAVAALIAAIAAWRRAGKNGEKTTTGLAERVDGLTARVDEWDRLMRRRPPRDG